MKWPGPMEVAVVSPLSHSPCFAAVGSLLGVVTGAAVATSAGTQPMVPWPSVVGIYVSSVLLSGFVWSGFAPLLDRLTAPTGLRFE